MITDAKDEAIHDHSEVAILTSSTTLEQKRRDGQASGGLCQPGLTAKQITHEAASSSHHPLRHGRRCGATANQQGKIIDDRAVQGRTRPPEIAKKGLLAMLYRAAEPVVTITPL